MKPVPYVGKFGFGHNVFDKSETPWPFALTEHRPTRAQGRDRLCYHTPRAVVREVYADACGGRIAVRLDE